LIFSRFIEHKSQKNAPVCILQKAQLKETPFHSYNRLIAVTKSRHPRQKTASLDGNLSPIKHGNHLPLPQRLSVAFPSLLKSKNS